MKRPVISSLCTLAATIAITSCNSGSTSSLPATAGQTAAATHPVPEWQAKHLAQAACPPAGPGEAQCAALVMNEGGALGLAGASRRTGGLREMFCLPLRDRMRRRGGLSRRCG